MSRSGRSLSEAGRCPSPCSAGRIPPWPTTRARRFTRRSSNCRKAARQKLALDLGAVGLAAEAWVNGKKVGERAWRPFWFDISKAVRAGNNTLRIRVANSNAGWEAQGGTIYGKGSWGLKYNTERDRLATLHPNGLEGPVVIMVGD